MTSTIFRGQSKEDEVSKAASPKATKVLTLAPQKLVFPLATTNLQEFLSLVQSGKIETLAILGMGKGDLDPRFKMCVRSDTDPNSAKLHILLMREALENVAKKIINPSF
jgi:hypothetical protein